MIKFRAWDKKTKSFINDCDIVLDLISGKVFAGDIGLTDSINDVTDQIVLMQSTGLKDKNGVEIYEGDIVQSTWYDVDNNPYKKKGEITYVGAQYVIVYDSQFDVETGEITYDAHNLTYAEDAEVIGNIYENPELLNSGIE